MPSMTKQRVKDRQLQAHVAGILEDASFEAFNGRWDNALLITERAATEILLASGRKIAVNATGDTPKPNPRQSSSLIRAFDILAVFTSEVTLLGIGEVSDKTGMPPSTTHRYMRTLVALGQLEQDIATRKYRRIPA